jgi:hydrogenase-1 operon protein HyaE
MNAALSPLYERLTRQGYRRIDADALDAVAAGSTHLLVMLNEDPLKYPEVLDNAVIVPEVLREFPAGTLDVAFADEAESRRIAQRFGIVKFPALLFLRRGDYLGVIAGLLDWPDLVRAFADRLGGEPCRPPSVGIPVSAASPKEGCA